MRRSLILLCLVLMGTFIGCNSAPPADVESSSLVAHADDATFQTEVLGADVPVLVDFWAEWCGPCKALAPVVNSIADEYEGRIRVVKVDVDQAQQLASQYGIESIPTLIVFRNGQEMKRIVGYVAKDEITSAIDSAL